MEIIRRGKTFILVQPERWAVAVGPAYHRPDKLIHWETRKWIDNRNIRQSMASLSLFRLLEITFSRSLRRRASIEEVGRYKRSNRKRK
jgi:hypothetical protein